MGVLKVKSGGVWVPVAQGVGIASPGYVGHAVASSVVSGIGATVTDLGASVTFNAVAGHTYKTTVLSGRMDQLTTTSAGVFVGIYDAANTYRGGSYIHANVGSYAYVNTFVIESNISGSQTRKAKANTQTGTVTAQSGTIILVEDISTATMDGLASAWTAPTFQNSWHDFGSGYQVAQYRKVGDIVYLRGWVQGGATTVAMFILPAGFRPPAYVHVACEANDAFGELRCGPGGDVVLMAGNPATHVSLNNMLFSTVA
jgi:hypothetical protein